MNIVIVLPVIDRHLMMFLIGTGASPRNLDGGRPLRAFIAAGLLTT